MNASDWIKIEDRMPEHKQHILILYKNRLNPKDLPQYGICDAIYSVEQFIDIYTPCIDVYKVTHWMPVVIPHEED
jgi:hypothetical protein